MSLHVFAGPGRGRDTIVVVDGEGLHGAELTDADTAAASAAVVEGGRTQEALAPHGWRVPFRRMRRIDGLLLADGFRIREEGGGSRQVVLVDRKTRDAVLSALDSTWPGAVRRREKRRELIVPLVILGALIGFVLWKGGLDLWKGLGLLWYAGAWISYARNDRLILEVPQKL